MAASPLPNGVRIVLFGQDPNLVHERRATLESAGYETVIPITASEAESYVAAGLADVLRVGSQTGPLTRIRLAEQARQKGVVVVHIAYPNHPATSEDEVYVTRPLGRPELLDAVGRALSRFRR